MKYSVTLFQTGPIPDLVEAVQTAEDEGFDHVWLGDSHMIWREAYVALVATLQATSRIRLGLAVTNPLTRHPTVTASAFATLAEMYGPRVVLGIGLGDSATETIGMQPAKRAQLRDAVVGIRTLLDGGRIEVDGVEARLDWLPAGLHVPIFVGGSGPRMLELMGELGEGVIVMAGASSGVLSVALDKLRQSAGDRRQHSVAWVPASVLPDGGTARDNVRGHVARCATHALPWTFEPADQRLVEQLREAYDYYGHLFPASPQADLVNDRLVELFAIAGTPEDARARLDELVDAPVDEIAFVLHGDRRKEQLRLLAREVIGARTAGTATHGQR